MKKKFLFNPFYWYGIIWSVIIILYSFGWSALYEPLCAPLLLFFLFTIICSFAIGYFSASKFSFDCGVDRRPKKCFAVVLGIIALYFIEFAYCGFIPVVKELSMSNIGYADFTGIPILHVIVVTFSLFYAIYMFYYYIQSTGKARYNYLKYFLSIVIMFILLYNRSLLMMTFFMCALIVLSRIKRIRLKHIVILTIAIFIALVLFGVLGNIRCGYKWNDSSMIINLAHINLDKYPAILPKSLLWSYVYLVSPLGNMNNLVLHYAPQSDFVGLCYSLIPDFLAKRIFPDVDLSIQLIESAFTVSTGFAGIYKFGGILGMIILYLEMVAMGLLFEKISRGNRFSHIGTCLLSVCVFSFMFFANFVAYSGLTFAFLYTIGLSYIRSDKCAKAIDTKVKKDYELQHGVIKKSEVN